MTTYSDEFIEQCFGAWYQAGRTQGGDFKNLMAESGVDLPSYRTISEWSTKYDWNQRADALDAEISVRNDETIINARADMFKKQVKYAETLLEKGLAYLEENGITSDNAAIRAIDLGLTTQRIAVGAAETLVKISKMDDEALNKEIYKILGKNPNGNAVDAEVSEE